MKRTYLASFYLYVFTALEFDGNYFGILLWKIVNHETIMKLKHQLKKIFWKYKLIRQYFVMSQKYLSWSFVNKFHDLTRYPTTKRTKYAVIWKPLFRRKWTFLNKLDLLEADNFPNLCPRGFNKVYVNKVFVNKSCLNWLLLFNKLNQVKS